MRRDFSENRVCSESKNKPCFGVRRMSFVERFPTHCHFDLAIVPGHCSLSYRAIFKSQLVNQHTLGSTSVSHLRFWCSSFPATQ